MNIHLTLRLAAFACLLGFLTSCTTTYDAYGRPQQSVDPAVAVVGMVAAGAIGYAAANNNGNRYYNNRYSNYDRHYSRGYRRDFCAY